jgi:hypothetical protein
MGIMMCGMLELFMLTFTVWPSFSSFILLPVDEISLKPSKAATCWPSNRALLALV